MTSAQDTLGQMTMSVASGDSLDVRQFTVHERISSLFAISVVALSDNPNIEFDGVVGRPARFAVASGGQERSWSGVCNRLQHVAVEERGLSTYHLTLVPTLWFTTQRRNYRIFQQASELDTVLQLLSEWGIEPMKKLEGKYKKRKYRVQYGESDYTFISRMLEDVGVSFYFASEGDETRLVLTDAPQSAEPRKAGIAFRDHPTIADREHVTSVRIGQQVRPGRVTVRDHDYRLPPNYKLMASAAGGADVEQQLEQFHYVPGAFLFGTERGEDTPFADDRGKTRTDELEGATIAQRRIAAERSNALAATFDTNVLDLAPGVVMGILDHPRSELGEGKRLLVVDASMSGTPASITHTCEVRSAEQPYYPPQVTPKPKVSGVESATIVGPPGEEIHTDEFGRVRVHFHWDRESQMDDRSSCWIHVSQPWGGSGFGGTNLPRVGQEVLVDFIAGDPDRPVIVGRLYTNLQKTPYKLPDNKTQSGWKSNSTNNTGGYNELMFEDAAGKELVRMQAEKDMHKLVKNDEQSTVGRDRTRLVKRNEDITIGQNRTKRVVSNEQETIGQSQTSTVGVNRATQVGAVDSTIVGETHVVIVSPPGEGGGGPVTSLTMSYGTIILDTGLGATITMAQDTVSIAAKTINLTSTADIVQTSGGKIYLNS